jgi:hypothetical protein
MAEYNHHRVNVGCYNWCNPSEQRIAVSFLLRKDAPFGRDFHRSFTVREEGATHSEADFRGMSTLNAALYLQDDLALGLNPHIASHLGRLIEYLGKWHFRDELAKSEACIRKVQADLVKAQESLTVAQADLDKHPDGYTLEDLEEDLDEHVLKALQKEGQPAQEAR